MTTTIAPRPPSTGRAPAGRRPNPSPLPDLGRDAPPLKRLLAVQGLSSNAKVVASTLDDFAWGDRMGCWPSNDAIGRLTGLPKYAVQGALVELELAGFFFRLYLWDRDALAELRAAGFVPPWTNQAQPRRCLVILWKLPDTAKGSAGATFPTDHSILDDGFKGSAGATFEPGAESKGSAGATFGANVPTPDPAKGSAGATPKVAPAIPLKVAPALPLEGIKPESVKLKELVTSGSDGGTERGELASPDGEREETGETERHATPPVPRPEPFVPTGDAHLDELHRLAREFPRSPEGIMARAELSARKREAEGPTPDPIPVRTFDPVYAPGGGCGPARPTATTSAPLPAADQPDPAVPLIGLMDLVRDPARLTDPAAAAALADLLGRRWRDGKTITLDCFEYLAATIAPGELEGLIQQAERKNLPSHWLAKVAGNRPGWPEWRDRRNAERTRVENP